MPTILVIDANPTHSLMIETLFINAGYEVVAARRGDDGLRLASEVKPDLVFVDAVMPDLTGFQVCRQFQNNKEIRSIPIVLMSGLARFANQRQFAWERGAREMISKPLQIIQLGDVVDRYVPGKPAIPLPAASASQRVKDAPSSSAA